MVIVYNIGLCFFYGLMCVAAVFHKKARKWVMGRNGVVKHLKKQFAPADKVIWMHCSSLGEFEQGRTLLDEFRQNKPDYKILLTFFSPSGYDLRKNYEGADYVSYLPLDTWLNARRFIKAVNPQIVIFVKYDFWYHHLHQAKKRGAKLYLISALFRHKQAFFKWYGGFFRSMLRTFTRIFVQNVESQKLLQSIIISNVEITGDTRIDRVRQIAQQAKHYPLIEQFVDNKLCLICGSTWPKDEAIIQKSLKNLPDVKLVIAPHLIHDEHIADIEKLFADKNTLRYTTITNNTDVTQYDVLIVNTIGMLSSVYRYGNAAYIGGGFEDGIHNTLEAVVYGIPVAFGPNYHKFVEAIELIELGGAVSINGEKELQPVLEGWFSSVDSKQRLQAGEVCKNYIWAQASATDIVFGKINEDID